MWWGFIRNYDRLEANQATHSPALPPGMLSRIVRLRRQLAEATTGTAGAAGEERVYPLQLIIMSATLRCAEGPSCFFPSFFLSFFLSHNERHAAVR